MPYGRGGGGTGHILMANTNNHQVVVVVHANDGSFVRSFSSQGSATKIKVCLEPHQ
jgi:hypothetical protein